MDPNSAETKTALGLLEFAGEGSEIDTGGLALGRWAWTMGLAAGN